MATWKIGRENELTLNSIVKALRAEHGPQRVPGFDPTNGNERARVLFLFESPGPGAVQSGYVSMDNDDPSARNWRKQVEEEAGLLREDIAIWNIVPWYVGESDFSKLRKISKDDISHGVKWLPALVAAIPQVKIACFVGVTAHVGARYVQCELLKRHIARIDLWHPSGRAMVGEAGKARWDENVSTLQFIAESINC